MTPELRRVVDAILSPDSLPTRHYYELNGGATFPVTVAEMGETTVVLKYDVILPRSYRNTQRWTVSVALRDFGPRGVFVIAARYRPITSQFSVEYTGRQLQAARVPVELPANAVQAILVALPIVLQNLSNPRSH